MKELTGTNKFTDTKQLTATKNFYKRPGGKDALQI
jgi:hypothetical protein